MKASKLLQVSIVPYIDNGIRVIAQLVYGQFQKKQLAKVTMHESKTFSELYSGTFRK